MNLWFRLLMMLLRRPWRRPVHGLDSTVVRMRVWPLDLDLNRHVTNGRYFTLADVGRMDFVLRSGAHRVALRHRAVPIVADVWGKFRQELRLFQAFEIHTRLLGWDTKWMIMEHRFVRAGRVIGVVVMRGTFRSAQGTVDPREFAREMGEEASPPLPAWVEDWGRACDGLSGRLRQEEGRKPADAPSV